MAYFFTMASLALATQWVTISSFKPVASMLFIWYSMDNQGRTQFLRKMVPFEQADNCEREFKGCTNPPACDNMPIHYERSPQYSGTFQFMLKPRVTNCLFPLQESQ